MHPIVKGSIFGIFMTISSWHYGASFDCAKASSVSENLICTDYELSQKDDELNLVFQQARSIFGNDSEFRKIILMLGNGAKQTVLIKPAY